MDTWSAVWLMRLCVCVPVDRVLMPLFSRSSEKKPRSHHRFSFRRHSQEATEPSSASSASSSAPQTSRFPVPQTPRKAVEHPQPQLKQQQPRQPGANGSSITSEAATSVSSSLRSSGSLSFVDRKSAGAASGVSAGGAATAAETSSSSESESEVADSLQHVTVQKGGLVSRSISSSSSVASSQSMRNSLADYRQLRCSMSYKNRIGGVGVGGGSAGDLTFRNTSSITSASSSSDGRLSDMRMTDLRMTGMSARISETSRSSRVSESHERSSTSLSTSPQQQQRVSIADDNSTNSNNQQRSSESSAATSPAQQILTEVRMTEANVAAMQTRRALQQMVLAMDEEDEDDSENEYESESEFVVRRSSSAESFGSGRHNVLQVSADDYRKFQFRLRQLEDLCAEQARKQASIEETIEREVRDRTRKVVDAMEKNIAMYRQAKELECEREIQKRVSELEQQNGNNGRGSVRSSTFRENSVGRSSTMLESEKGSKPLEKLFHPRRARRRLEMMKEREEQQKREMEQFREFIRSAEMNSATTESAKASSAALRELGDPQITEALMGSSQEELVEMICVLRKHVGVQEAQLDEAKALISAAIEAREEAEDTAREAVELTLQLDSRLMRASQEIVFIRDELRESQLYSQSRSMSPNDHSMLSLPRTSSFLQSDSGRGRYSSYNMPFTPSSSC